MDILSFIKSRDIREHLKEIDYRFTAPEAAFLVFQSPVPLIKKIEAWQEIIDTMPDCSMEERSYMPDINSFHNFLRDYIGLECRILDRLFLKENAVYSFRCWKRGPRPADCDYMPETRDEVFSDLDSCIDYFKSRCRSDEVQDVEFRKRYFSSATEGVRELTLGMDRALEILYVDCRGVLDDDEGELESAFDGMWFEFPTPFRRGDIVFNCCEHPAKPMVLDSICTWDAKKMMEFGCSEKYSKQFDLNVMRARNDGMYLDMDYKGYYIEDGIGIRHSTGWSYLDLEKKREPLEEQFHLLEVISRAIKGREEINLEYLFGACKLFALEAEMQKLKFFLKTQEWSRPI